MLRGKNILLGICGSIASYKSAFLIRLLVKQGANVQVIMTPGAAEFITPLTLSTLSKRPVLIEFTHGEQGEWNNHVELGLWADLFLIAPASANTIAKLANGICDNLLSAVYLSARCPVYFAPSMDLDMWAHASTQVNTKKLQQYGNIMIEPTYGELASGLTGEGRMAEPEEIVELLKHKLAGNSPLSGKKVLITAGPTYEAIDPVRFIGNHSSGKMGFALAEEAAAAGADVMLISGPSQLQIKNNSIQRVDVRSAHDMYEACIKHFADSTIVIMSAAVADYTPTVVEDVKIKKKSDSLVLDLVKTRDILAELGKLKKQNQLLIGFALETNNELENAKEKIKNKNLDLIILNSLKNAGAGFGTDTNQISIINKNNVVTDFPLKSKTNVAKDIIHSITELLANA